MLQETDRPVHRPVRREGHRGQQRRLATETELCGHAPERGGPFLREPDAGG